LSLVVSLCAFGCDESAGDEDPNLGPLQAEVTADNYVDLAATAAEVARDAWVANMLVRGVARQLYLNFLETPATLAAPATTSAVSVDPVCDSGTSTFTADPASPGRYEVEYAECFLSTDRCTINGIVALQEGEVDGDPFTAEGSGLLVECEVVGSFDLDGSRISCDYDEFDDEPRFDADCEFDLPGVRGSVSRLDFELSEVQTSGLSYEVGVLAKVVDPDHGEFSFEAIDLDIDSCLWAVPYSGSLGGGRDYGTAPMFWATFGGSCASFTACFFETQEDLDRLECTLSTVVSWEDVAPPATDGVVQPVSVKATSYYNATTDPNNLINGSGLSGTGPLEDQTHALSSNANGMWHAGPVAGALGGPTGDPPTVSGQALEFDLGVNMNLEGAYIWNSSQAPTTDRGVEDYEILVSSADTGSFVSAGTFRLAQNSNDPRQIGTLSQFVAFEAVDVRRVRFEIQSAHSGESAEYVGLSEVAFLANDSPE
jgi:hypothetical protein